MFVLNVQCNVINPWTHYTVAVMNFFKLYYIVIYYILVKSNFIALISNCPISIMNTTTMVLIFMHYYSSRITHRSSIMTILHKFSKFFFLSYNMHSVAHAVSSPLVCTCRLAAPATLMFKGALCSSRFAVPLVD